MTDVRPSPSPTTTSPLRRPAVARAVLPLPIEEAWDLLVDVRNHERWIPLTRIEATWPARVGDAFEAVSGPPGVPALGFPDRMVIEALDEPGSTRHADGRRRGRVIYRKQGPVLLGTAELHLREAGASTEVVWIERVHLRGLPVGLAAPVLRPVLTAMLRFALHRVSGEVAGRR